MADFILAGAQAVQIYIDPADKNYKGIRIAAEAFAKANVKLDTLSNYETLIELAAAEGYVSESDLEFLGEWRKAPDKF